MPSHRDAKRITIHNLSYHHGGKAVQFERLSLALEPRRYGLIGRNGSGKTTLLRLLYGEIAPSGGRVHLPQPAAYVPQDLRSESARSGGECMRDALLSARSVNPLWLLLDEPTNHLDDSGRDFVCRIVRTWSGGLIVATHDLRVLDLVDEILETREGTVNRYGLGYRAYLQARAAHEDAVFQAYRSAQAWEKRERRDLAAALERSARSAASGRKRAMATNVDKAARGAMQRAGENSAAKSKALHGERVRRAQDRAERLRARMCAPISLAVDLDGAALPAGKNIVSGAFNPVFEDGATLWNEPLMLAIAGPERIHLAGPNGSGKTLLLRLIAGAARVRAVYMDQSLSLLPAGATLVEAMRAFAPALAEHERRIRLGRSGFEQERALQAIATLSGGERVRAAFAMLFAGTAPQLLLLDEPTNNLDTDAVDELVEALRAYSGALVLASHDRAFVERVRIERTIRLA